MSRDSDSDSGLNFYGDEVQNMVRKYKELPRHHKTEFLKQIGANLIPEDEQEALKRLRDGFMPNSTSVRPGGI